MANDSIRGRQVVLRLTNKSGGDVVEGDVVIISSGTAAAFTTTTTAGLATDIVGVVLESIADNATGRVCISGYVPKIALSASASLGDTFATHTVAKQAAPAAARATGAFGQVLGTGATPAALLWGMPDNSASGGAVATDTIWDAAGDLVQGTGSNAGARLPIGTANQLLRVNSGATAVEWASVGRVLISEASPDGVASVDWSSIAATYKSLEIEIMARSTQAATAVYFNVYFNNDTTATNYRFTKDGASAGSAANAGDALAYGGVVAAANATAGQVGSWHIKINDYAGTTFNKMFTSIGGHREADATLVAAQYTTEWESTTAINRITVTLAAGNFLAGSRLRLYGVN